MQRVRGNVRAGYSVLSHLKVVLKSKNMSLLN